MTTFTTEDRKHAFGGAIDVEPVKCSVTVNVEPIPFMGMVTLQDEATKEQMLRDQIRMQQNEIGRLKAKLMEHGIND